MTPHSGETDSLDVAVDVDNYVDLMSFLLHIKVIIQQRMF